MKRIIIGIIVFFTVIVCFFIGIYISKIVSIGDGENLEIAKAIEIEDECTAEYEYYQTTEAANAQAEKNTSNEINNECYIVKDLDGYVAVYALDVNENEILQQKTEISTKFLTATDIAKLQYGVKLQGKENLNKLLEDLE